MAYSVHFVADVGTIPEAARLELHRTMQQVADAVEAIAPANAFWSSLHSSVLQIDAAGFRLVYRILLRSREIHVIETTPLRAG